MPYHCELIWVEATNGCIPTGAVKGGYNNGDDLYIGRAPLEGSMAIGKVHYLKYCNCQPFQYFSWQIQVTFLQVHPENGCCYISFGGKEYAKQEYQVLVANKIDL